MSNIFNDPIFSAIKNSKSMGHVQIYMRPPARWSVLGYTGIPYMAQ
jgi:hypothetical protein